MAYKLLNSGVTCHSCRGCQDLEGSMTLGSSQALHHSMIYEIEL